VKSYRPIRSVSQALSLLPFALKLVFKMPALLGSRHAAAPVRPLTMAQVGQILDRKLIVNCRRRRESVE